MKNTKKKYTHKLDRAFNLKSRSKIEPVYNNIFDIHFQSQVLDDESKTILSNQVISFYYYYENENTFGIDFNLSNIDIKFYLNVIKNKIQPITILEKIKKNKTEFNIILTIQNNVGDILRKIKFLDCSITNIAGMEYFDYTSNNIMELNCSINYKSKKIKK